MHMGFSRPFESRSDRTRSETKTVDSHSEFTGDDDQSDERWLHKLTDQQLMIAIPQALEQWTSVSSSRKESLAGRRDWHEFTAELERRYPLAKEDSPPSPAE